MQEIILKFPRKLEYLNIATNLASLVSDKLEKDNILLLNKIELAVSEACTNAIKYAKNTNRDDTLVLSFKILPDKLSISLQDKGQGFDINNIPDPDFDIYPERGYGIYILKKMMDKISYKIGENGYNTLIMEMRYKNTHKIS